MRKRNFLFIVLFYFCFVSLLIANETSPQLRDASNGVWSAQRVTLYDTPEADIMVRVGDIDNLGFGWPTGFNPFSGNETPVHDYPWTPDPADVSGTDRIMVVSGYDYYHPNPPNGEDGYTNTTSRPSNLPRPITMYYDRLGIPVDSAILQMFVDDFQAPIWRADYKVFLNGERAQFLERIINLLHQTGPVGQILTVPFPQDYLYLLESDSLSIFIDDNTTGAGEGYAIDFVKLLINSDDLDYVGTIQGTVIDSVSGSPLQNVYVSTSNYSYDYTDLSGFYQIDDVPAGIVVISAEISGYQSKTKIINITSTDTKTVNFELYPNLYPPNGVISIYADSVHLNWNSTYPATYYKIYSSTNPNIDKSAWTLEDSTTQTHWTEPVSDIKKFYYITTCE